MSGLRALIVTTVHVPGDARILERQIPTLRAAGFGITYAAPWTTTGTPVPAGLRTFDLPRAVGRARMRALLAAWRLLRKEADAHDVVIVHDPELLLAAGLARLRVPVVWDVHEDLAASLVARAWLPRPVRPVVASTVRALERWAERQVHLILAEHAYRDRFHREHPVVPNVPLVPSSVTPPGDDRVVYLGRVARARGAVELVELGRRLRGEVEVEVIGDAEADVVPLLASADARGEITWRGFMPNREALGRVAGAMAGLSLLHDLPNFRGSMPTKVLEYLACSVPVVTTPLPLAAEVVRAADAGVVVGFGDVDAAEDAIRRLQVDEQWRRAAAIRGRELVRSRYSWEAEAPAFVDHVTRWARARQRP